MRDIKLYSKRQIPIERHKVRVVQSLNLHPVETRAQKIQEAGFNTFLLKNKDVFMDMLTDSGVNAMSDRQVAAMSLADDSYAGSQTFDRFEKAIQETFQMDFVLPAHQGRACENILSQGFVTKDSIVPMNYHFTTTKAHILRNGGTVIECLIPQGLEIESDFPFKGNMDIEQLKNVLESNENIAFVRMEAGTNLIGGQPFSLANARAVSALCKQHQVKLVLDASLLTDNLYFMKTREDECKDMSILEINHQLSACFDIIYFSARKLGSARGGAIALRHQEDFDNLKSLVTLYEGFLTYGGMSVREMEAIVIGLEEAMTLDMIEQGPLFIQYMVNQLQQHGVPVLTPAGGLGCHLDASQFLNHLPQDQYPSGSLAAALFIAGGIRTMERGTLSEERNPDGSEHLSNMELVRIALPRRVFTLSQVDYVIDRIVWLFDNRHLIGGLEFVDEPQILRFFTGKLKSTTDWPQQLVNQFKKDFDQSL